MSGIILPFKNLRLRVGGFMLLLLSAVASMAQTAGSENVGIGTTKPDISAILDLTSNSKGFLVPRMTLAQRGNIKSPANGLLVYQTDFFSGFYFFDGTSWKGLYARSADGAVITPSSSTPTSSSLPASSSENAWSINGNSGLNSDVNFIGTLDTTSLVFKVNNYRSGFIDYRFGNTYFGYRAGYRSHGFNSVAIGAYALHDANLGLNNIAIGYQSLPITRTGSDNIALGSSSLYSNTTGSQNVAIGSQAGLRSVGDGNIFIGHKSGLEEVGDNKLYIENGMSTLPLIFGDFEMARIGINTKQPESALSIDSKVANVSGLEFKQLTNSSPAGRPTQKVLSVDDKGRVILVRDSIGIGSGIPPTIAPSYWALKGSSIENSNAGDVILSNIRFKNLRAISPATKSNLKVLTVDDNGLIVLAKDSIGTSTPNYWTLNENAISNNNSGKLILNGGIQLGNIKASNKAFNPYGKVLTVDDSGNLILVRDSVGTSSGIPVSSPSPWSINGNNISNTNIGTVAINSGLILSKLSSESTPTITAQKFLTVDNIGNVILANTPVNNILLPVAQWTTTGENISNANTGAVYVNNSLRAKKGIYLESGVLEVNSAIENKSGLQFAQIKSSNPAEKSNGKVLSVDTDGNVILVRDSVGTTNTIPVSTSSWSIAGNTISNNNAGRVFINNGLTLPQITSETVTTVNAQKFLTVDNTGNVILGNVINTGTPTATTWAINGNNVTNSNLGRVYITNGLSSKNGLIVESGNLEANGGLVLSQLKLSSAAAKSNGKVLSVDDNGRVVLVKDSVGVVSTGTTVTTPSSWNISGNNIVNSNTGSVAIANGLTLSKLSSNDAVEITAQKVLSVNATGNVILANIPAAPAAAPQLWKEYGSGGLINNSSAGVSIKSAEDGKSGLQLVNLKASSAVSLAGGKVLSVDDNGNVVLVYDYAGEAKATSNEWATIDGRIHNKNNGKVVIGTGINSFPDGFQLFVKGGILTERVRVAVANSDRWADYVFKKGYQLMPLRDVEKFIKHHQHLPNVPSAEEMAKNGLDVMETSAKLMEKLEELTLYMIDANKKIEALEEKVKTLEKVQK